MTFKIPHVLQNGSDCKFSGNLWKLSWSFCRHTVITCGEEKKKGLLQTGEADGIGGEGAIGGILGLRYCLLSRQSKSFLKFAKCSLDVAVEFAMFSVSLLAGWASRATANPETSAPPHTYPP